MPFGVAPTPPSVYVGPTPQSGKSTDIFGNPINAGNPDPNKPPPPPGTVVAQGAGKGDTTTTPPPPVPPPPTSGTGAVPRIPGIPGWPPKPPPHTPPPHGQPPPANTAEQWYTSVIAANPNTYDTSIGKDVWLSWFPKWHADTKSFESIKKDASGNPIGMGADGKGFAKPTDCPGGTQAWAQDYCLPVGDPRLTPGAGGGGAGGGAGAAGAGAGAGGTGGFGNLFGGGPAGWGLSNEEKAYLNSLTQLAGTMSDQAARLFGTGFPAYARSTDFWMKASGAYGKAPMLAALGPAREQAEETYKGAESKLRNLRGAEKAGAEAELTRAEAGQLGGMAAGEQETAAQNLLQAGEFGTATGITTEGQAAGLFGAAQQAKAQSRLTEEGFGVQLGIAGLQATTWMNVAALQAHVSEDAIAAQKDVAMATLAQRASEFEQSLALQMRQLLVQMQEFYAGLSVAQQGQQTNLFGSIFGDIFKLIGFAAFGPTGGGK